ncbi:MAG: hypothetical protein SFX72_14000 [Isosphaeraceae bacterium]|nr:hypothetical protein [Isosphaeraceae bacterium]
MNRSLSIVPRIKAGNFMDRDDLVGEWVLPSGSRAKLGADGSASFTAEAGAPARVGSWRYVDQGHFETSEAVPANPGSGHNPNGFDDVSYYEIVEANPDWMLVVGFEGGADGLERDPVRWSRP